MYETIFGVRCSCNWHISTRKSHLEIGTSHTNPDARTQTWTKSVSIGRCTPWCAVHHAPRAVHECVQTRAFTSRVRNTNVMYSTYPPSDNINQERTCARSWVNSIHTDSHIRTTHTHTITVRKCNCLSRWLRWFAHHPYMYIIFSQVDT